MNLAKRIMLLWISILGLFGLSFYLPHDNIRTFSVLSYSLQLLLFLVCAYMVRFEPTKKNKYIFVNFALFFSLSVPSHLYSFVGTVFFRGEAYAKMYMAQYVSFGAYFFFLTFSLGYLAVDALFREFRVVQKYLIVLAIVGGFFVYYYHPILLNPKYLYNTEDILDWKVLDRAVSEFRATNNYDPSPETLAATVEMHSWKDGQATGILYPSEKLRRVNELLPYLSGSNYLILLYKPIYLNTIYMCVLCVGFILLFFGYQYMKDPPQGAYIDKIMFLFLIFSSMEILHAWSFVRSLEWETFFEIVSVGQYVSIAILSLIALFFCLRLRFITSANGEFYEQEIASSPSAITRWRDPLDNLVIAHFFNRHAILGRLFVDPKRNE